MPEGAQLGLGVRTAAIRNLQHQGALTNTGNTFDLALNGRGWFQMTTPNGDTVYTRAGAFNTNAHGPARHLDGYSVTPVIVVPPNTTSVTVSQSGLVTATVAGQTDAADARPADDRQFRQRGRPRAARQQPVPADRGLRPADRRRARRPRVRHDQQGYLEASNVDPVKEITDLISAQRAYEMNSKVIQAADQMAGTISNMRS